MLIRNIRFRVGLTLLLGALAALMLFFVVAGSESMKPDRVAITLVACGAVFFGGGVAGAFLMAAPLRDAYRQAKDAAPLADEEIEAKSRKYGLAMLIVAALPLLVFVLLLQLPLVPGVAFTPLVWVALLGTSGVLLLRHKPAGAYLGVVVVVLGSVGVLAALLHGRGEGAKLFILFFGALAFSALPRLWQHAIDLGRLRRSGAHR